eukprot:6194858-Pleurochrysis_carterae.AAC.1
MTCADTGLQNTLARENLACRSASYNNKASKQANKTNKASRATQNRDKSRDRCKTFCCRSSDVGVGKGQASGGHAVRLVDEPLLTQARRPRRGGRRAERRRQGPKPQHRSVRT